MEITKVDINRPFAEFVDSNKEKVVVEDDNDYLKILLTIEDVVLFRWQTRPILKDKSVISAYKKLTKDFDNQKKGSLASEISMQVKTELVRNKIKGGRNYTYGEIMSCLKYLIKIVENHHRPDGRGYLYWVKTIFEGNMPETEEEILKYILKHEM